MRMRSDTALIVAAMVMDLGPETEQQPTLRPTNMKPRYDKQTLVKGCGSAGCRTLEACLCSCRKCRHTCRVKST